MKKIKKIIAILTVFLLLSSIIPEKALALEEGGVPSQEIEREILIDSLEKSSDIEGADFDFTGIATSWSNGLDGPQIYLRLGKEKDALRDWFLVNGEDDSRDGSEGRIYGGIINSDKDRYFQYKVVFSGNDLGKTFNLKLSIFDTSRQSLGGMRIASDNSGLGPKIISRKEWGANEAYMEWEPEYGEVKAFVVHHTAGEEGTKISQAEAVKGLYYGHAVSYGWGDVGYNYIIDINGNIYEGRAGGNSVIGGHTLGYNTGTIGISLIGDYNTRTVEVAQYEALINLIAYKSFQNGIDPSASVYLKNKTISTIVGHKDLNATQCPGNTLYERMNDLRIKVKDKLGTYPAKNYGAQVVSFDNGANLFGGDTQKVLFSARNTGNTPWLAEGAQKASITSLDSRFQASLVDFGRSVEPGEIGNFEVGLTTPLLNQTVSLGFQMKIGGSNLPGGEFTSSLNISSPEYRAKLISKSADQMVKAGSQFSVWAEFKNTGVRNWSGSEGIKLATEGSRESAFFTNGDWESKSSPGVIDRTAVNSGDTVRVSFLATAPNTAGNYKEKFILKSGSINLEGGNDLVAEWNFQVGESEGQLTNSENTRTYSGLVQDYNFEIVNQSSYLNLTPGGTGTVLIEAKNTGSSTWYKDIFRLATVGPRDRQSEFSDTTWLGKNRIEMSQYRVDPGQVASFSFTVKSPQRYGKFKEYFGFVAEGVGWLHDIGIYWELNNNPPSLTSQFNEGKTSFDLVSGNQQTVTWKIKNTSNQTWTKSSVRLGTAGPQDRNSAFADSSWLGGNRIQFAENTVAPGETATFNFTLNTNNSAGSYKERFRLVSEGVAWFNEEFELNLIIGGEKDDFDYVSQSPFITLNRGEVKQVWVEVKNTGTRIWKRDGDGPIRLATSNPRDRTSKFIAANRVYMDRDTVNPGENVRFTFNITAPYEPGVYKEYFTLVREGVSWFKDIGIYWELNVLGTGGQENINQNVTSPTGNIETIEDSKKVKISGTGNFIIVNESDAKIAEGGASDQVEVFYKNGKNYLNFRNQQYTTNGWFRVVPWAPNTILRIDSYTDRPAWNQAINDNTFKGVIEVRYSTENKKLWAVNDVNLEDYLKGVSEPLEAGAFEYIKAAVIAERSYILNHLNKGGRWPADNITLKNSRNGNGDDQIYQGYGFTQRATNIPNAVSATVGEIVTYNGNLVLTPYYTQSDGRTRNISEVWGSKQSDYPWLVSVPDPWSAGQPMLGHGVGMSGRGARGMGAEGKNYKEILKYFYTGTDVSKVDTNRNVRVGIYAIDI